MRDQAKFMTCVEHKSGDIITAAGRMAYEALLTPALPKGEKDPGKKKFQLTLLFPKEANLDLLAMGVNALIAEKWGDVAAKKIKVKKPFLKTEDSPKLAEYAADYPVFVRLNANLDRQPGIAHPNSTPCNQAQEIYPGRWARCLVNPYAYDHPTGGKGISLGLVHVQLLAHDDRIAIRGVSLNDAFEPVEEVGGGAGGSSTDALFD